MEDGLVHHIITVCEKRGIVLSEEHARYALRCTAYTLPLAPDGLLELAPSDIDDVLANAVDVITKSDMLEQRILCVQAAVSSTRKTLEATHRTELIRHNAKSAQFVSDICAQTSTNQAFGELVLYILHECHLFNRRDEAVYRNTIATLETVLSRSAVGKFIAQTTAEKTAQLEELWRIVWGVRLFNKYVGMSPHPDDSTPDFAAMTTAALETAEALVLPAAKAASQHLGTLSIVQDYACADSRALDAQSAAALNSEFALALLRAEVLHEAAAAVEIAKHQCMDLMAQFTAEVNNIQEIVSGNSAVSKSVVYPRFVQLVTHWQSVLDCRQFLEDAVHLAHVVLSNGTVEASNGSFPPPANEVSIVSEELISSAHAYNASRGSQPPAAAPRLAELAAATAQWSASLPDNSTPSLRRLCPVHLAQGIYKLHDVAVGYLTPMNTQKPSSTRTSPLSAWPPNTVLGFCSSDCMSSYVSDHRRYRPAPLALKISPFCLELVGFGYALPVHIVEPGYISGRSGAGGLTRRADAGTQTGQIDPYWDYNYQWNEWTMRKLALRLADLRNKKTHSSQTVVSVFRRDAEMQAYPPKDASQQTPIDGSAQTSKVVRVVPSFLHVPCAGD